MFMQLGGEIVAPPTFRHILTSDRSETGSDRILLLVFKNVSVPKFKNKET